jgi:hypothetical protein
VRNAFVIAVCSLAALGQSKPAQPVPVIVELFTSEGCSSCPPADELLSRLEGRDRIPGAEVIALGEHVTYWDRLGWKDRFSQDVFTERQEAYSPRFQLCSVYTPQVVVNGQEEALGSEESRIRKEITKAAKETPAKVQVTLTGDLVSYQVTGLPLGARGSDVFLAVTETRIDTNVRSGENGGRSLRHTGVVRSLARVGKIKEITSSGYSAQARVHIDPQWKRANLKCVIFVQESSTRRIWGAGAMGLP